ncbi:MAG: hypothetical protein EOQ52_12745 [Mesorhizobium sp.]|uniref:hypothetical protein n=1 Tax=Mesorhizobium sp. TaxID=1871066 RepID=UPI000FE9C368|nr:hypothetical protein [Mesorhizobium sp.]RWB89237.1 MAG: hypothetical protein EOQ52_12745 [Mesorhizobium sp.]
MQFEHREVEKASSDGRRGPAERMIKLPGDKKHEKRSKSAKEIALQISLDNVDKQIEALKNG